MQIPARMPAIVSHHRVERLLAAWDKLEQPSDLTISFPEMLKHGAEPATAVIMKIKTDNDARSPVLVPVEHDPFSVTAA